MTVGLVGKEPGGSMSEHDRRTFMTTLTGIAALASVAAQPPAQPAVATPLDVTWFDAFKGKHKQVFDLGSFDLSVDSPLRQPVTYFAAHREMSHLEPPDDVNVLIGISHKSFAMNASDALWERFKLGEHWGIKDPSTGKPSTRNIFLGPATGAGAATIRGLQARGVKFWQCNFALGSVSAELAQLTGGKAADIRTELLAGLLPGVRLVPAHTWAIGFVQERGFTYEKL
jgi:hypothetical protein